MSLMRCPACKGGKNLMGIGMIYKTCQECNGTGNVDHKPQVKPVEATKIEPGERVEIMPTKEEPTVKEVLSVHKNKVINLKDGKHKSKK